ncbi:lactosylceramide 4-alpha-galactosyltransferase-like [Ornithodoros turicata]|uniref:lactosylceramide 4-alpha-galactosyltransferase-like n=1 Tax=Ornithodoros turicata TaxID=34597 RepID=UPI0031387419
MASRLRPYLVGLTALLVFLLYFTIGYQDAREQGFFEEDCSSEMIMFVESSGQGHLNGRISCALESTSKHNPERTVVLWYHEKLLSRDNPFIPVIERLGNVQLRNMTPEVIFKGTPLELWYASGILNQSSHSVVHLSDALRLALVYKFGGAYMDIDIVNLKPLNGLRNCISRSQEDMVSNAFLFFDRGHPFLLHCMRRFAENYKPHTWGENGPRLLRHVILKLCNKPSIRDLVGQPCANVTVLPSELLLPLNFTQWNHFFQRKHCAQAWNSLEQSYVMHIFGSRSSEAHVKENDGSAYEEAARLHCPKSFRTAIKYRGYF